MQVSPASRLFNYLAEFTAARPAEPRSAGAEAARRPTAAAAPAVTPTPTAAVATNRPATPTRMEPEAGQGTVTQAAPPAARPRLLPRGSLVNIIT